MSKILPVDERLKLLRQFYQDKIGQKWLRVWYRPSEMYVGMGYLAHAKCSFATARRDLDKLVDEGLLERRFNGKGWFQYYEYRLKSE